MKHAARHVPSPTRRRMLSAAAALTVALGWGCAGTAQAVGSAVDVTVIDRDAAGALPVYPYRGRSYVAGRPGARYAIRVTNRTGERVMAVMSVDGVNILTGQTADWAQSGYVLAPWQSYEITGWRKSNHEVAAFEFTSLPDSYAARTGRPNDVGVIGVAAFAERVVYRPQPQVMPAPPVVNRSEAPRAESRAQSREDSAGAGATAERSAEKSARDSARDERPSASAMARAPNPAPAPEPAERLGTGHGARESSYVTSTSFVRASSRPMEVVSLQYDRFENLVRAGVIPQYGAVDPQPHPFPRSPRTAGYVPDPPTQ